jgi:hypothetical protein
MRVQHGLSAFAHRSTNRRRHWIAADAIARCVLRVCVIPKKHRPPAKQKRIKRLQGGMQAQKRDAEVSVRKRDAKSGCAKRIRRQTPK